MPRFFGPHLPQVAHFHAHERPLPEFPALTHVHEAICAPAHFLAPHTHEIYELCYIHAGRGEWHAGGRNYPLQPGDLYITKPGEVHGGRVLRSDAPAWRCRGCGLDFGSAYERVRPLRSR